MAKYHVTKRSAIILFIAFLFAATLVGLLCGLLPTCEIEPVVPEPQKQAWENTRLPLTLSPVSYDLLVRTDLTNFVFSGSVEVLFECLEPTELILIHGKNLVVGEGRTTLKRDGGGTAPELLKEPWIYEENQFIVIELDGTLKKGDMYRLYIEFEGPLLDDLLGYYRMSYTTAAGEKRFLASTFFDPVDARKAFPCFDEPAMKATFTITLEHEPKYHALANSAKSGDDEILSDGWIRATFKETVKMSSYLVCYVVSDFKAKFTTTANGVKFGVWAREDYINQTDYALEKGAAVLDYFDGLYGEGVVYPMEKMDMIALPDFTAGAMENWGLITYRDTALLYEDGVSSESQKQRVCAIVAHELAHQWFGNLVTMQWWDHLWLNEGFASYVEYVGTVEVEPDWGMWDKFILYDLHRAMATDARVTSRPIINEVETPAEINSMFDRISYQKGSSVLRMMSTFLGDETFVKGLKYYLDAKQYGNAVNSDLWFHIDKAMKEDNINLGDGMDIATVMKTWMHQMGFPVIKVERDYTGNGQITARVEQKRFLSDPTADTETDYPDLGYVWYVPLTYTTSNSPEFESPESKWIRPEDEFVSIETPGSNTDWLLLNIDQKGIYRVNYDDQNWELIKAQLESNHKAISTASRASLISDAFSLAEASEISQSKAFDMTTYLKEERDFVPWYAVDGALSNTEKNLQRKGAFGNFQKYMRGQVTPMYEFVGWENTGDHLTRMSRGGAVSMACRYGNEDCIETSVNYYSQWMTNQDEIAVHPDMQATAYCSAIAAGGQDEWNFAFGVYTGANTPASVKARLLTAMACSKKPWILNTYLSYILDTSIIRAQDAADVITAVAGNPVGLPLAWDFFRGNWEFFRTGYGDTVFLLDSIISGITSYFNTPFELESLERFMADNPDQGTGARAFTEAVAVVKGNIRWIEQNYEDVDQWLQAAVTETKAWMDIRLPQTLMPEHYDLMVRTDLTNFVFSGSIKILIHCDMKTDVILVHSKYLNITEGVTTLVHADGGKAPTISKEPWLYEENEFLVVELNSYLTPGEKYNLYLEFVGPLDERLSGFYRSSYTTKLGEERHLANTFFDPIYARFAFPCFDEPDMKATFTITLENEPMYHALANTPQVGDHEVLSDGWIRATFEETVKMPTYLVCYVISDFKAKFTTTANGVTFGVWAQEDFINQTDYALEKGAAILDYFDNLYGLEIKYPLAKLDMVALPAFSAGAMENWGLVTYRESTLLYEEGVSTASRQQRVCTIIAHELAHQWFGNLVTMKWWDQLWLNEGITSYMEYVGTVEVEQDWAMWDKFVVYDLKSAMGVDDEVGSRPIVSPANTPEEIDGMFDTITYQKGASVTRMMNNFLGESTFLKGLKNYLVARQYDTAENSDLWFHLQAAADKDGIDFGDGITMETIMKPWVRQSGFPVVTVTRRYTGEEKITVLASQKRFLADPALDTPSSKYEDFGYEWYVPLTYITSANPSFNTPNYKWMVPMEDVTMIERSDIGGDTDWLLMNIDQQGVYRVNYDDANWKLLATQLRNDHQVISPASRAALINDAFFLASSDDLDEVIALEMTSYLKEERDYVPWYMVDTNVGYDYDQLALTEANATFEAYIKGQVEPMYKYIGWGDEGDNLRRLSRTRIVRMACQYRIENCTTIARNQYQQWMADSSFYLYPDLQPTVLCTGIAEGNQAQWDYAFEVFKDPDTDSTLKSDIRSALACSRDEATLSMYLNEILNTSVISESDGRSVLTTVASKPAGRELAWNFYTSNLEYFIKTYGNSVSQYSSIISGVTSDFNTQEKLEEVEQFFKDHPDQDTWKTAFEDAVAAIRAKIRWMDRNFDEVLEWLVNAGSEPWENLRIPSTVSPISYDLHVRTDLTNFIFNGSVRILVECFEKTDVIILHSKKLNITEGATTLMREDGGMVPDFKKEPWLYEKNEMLVIELDSMLEVGAKYYLYIEFAGPLLNDRQGYYRSVYTTMSGETRYLASTFFDPLDARKAFPCFDEPAMKATFTITLEHEPKYHALFNSPKIGDDEVLSDGWIKATFSETVKMSTYLVCYVISDFKAKFTTTEQGITFGVWAQEDFINQTDYALEKGAALLDFFDELYGMEFKYPMAKMDMIALPDFTAGAMENWGLVTYRENALLYEDGVSSESQKQRVCTIVSHELAHQWFGNLVTMDWWDYLWLNEGFASYVEYVGTVEVEPDWGMWDKFLINDMQRAMASDSLVTSRPVVAKSLTVSEVNAMFDRITYNKGSSVLRMMQQFLGEPTFLKGLKYYLAEQQYSSATNSDLWYNLDKAIKEDGIDLGEDIHIGDIMSPWTLQMGFPVVTVTRKYGDDDTMTMTASQKRFLTDPTSDPTSPFPDLGYVWHVPLTYTTEANPNYDTPAMKWLRPDEKSITVKVAGAGGDSSWLLANVDARGFYQVNYDETNWGLLAAQLESNHKLISTASRTSLIYDAFSLARAGELSQARALDLTAYLVDERDYVPWFTVDSVLGYIDDNLALTAANDNFETYMKKQVTPMYEYIGWENEGDHLKKMSRASAISLACQYGNDDCVQTALEKYAEWVSMANSSTINISPDLQATVFCTGIAAGSQADWDVAFTTYTNPNADVSLKSVLLPALACSKDVSTLSFYLSQVLDTSLIRTQDGKDVVIKVAGNPLGRTLAWEFFSDNWTFFREEYGNGVFLLEDVVRGVTAQLNTPEELAKVEQFIIDHPDQGSGERAFVQSIAVIKGNIRWMEQYYDEVADWVEDAA